MDNPIAGWTSRIEPGLSEALLFAGVPYVFFIVVLFGTLIGTMLVGAAYGAAPGGSVLGVGGALYGVGRWGTVADTDWFAVLCESCSYRSYYES